MFFPCQKSFIVKLIKLAILISLSGAFRFGAFGLSDGEPPGQCIILEVSLFADMGFKNKEQARETIIFVFL